MSKVYLDYNATTPLDDEVQTAICVAIKEAWGNPSSSHELGNKAKCLIDHARNQVANMIGALSKEIIFTSGGTETNHMVIQTAIKYFYCETNNKATNEIKPHIITTNIEHDSVKLPLEHLYNENKIDVTFVPVSKLTGAVEVDDIINAIKSNTCLITIMLANNETGIIQPVSLVTKRVREIVINRRNNLLLSSILFHTDAAQAIGKIEVDVQDLGVDYLTIVGHKFYGPRIGALYFNHTKPIFPIFYGGGQEYGFRPGTENTCMIVGLGKAAELVLLNLKTYRNKMETARLHLQDALESAFGDKIVFNNIRDGIECLPNTLSVAFNYENVVAKEILSETSNVYAGAGAACHKNVKVSNVLISSGVPNYLASKTLRLSVGRETVEKEIDIAVQSLLQTFKNLGFI